MMGEHPIDRLSKALVRGTSRKEFLQLLGATLASLLLPGGPTASARDKTVPCVEEGCCSCVSGSCQQTASKDECVRLCTAAGKLADPVFSVGTCKGAVCHPLKKAQLCPKCQTCNQATKICEPTRCPCNGKCDPATGNCADPCDSAKCEQCLGDRCQSRCDAEQECCAGACKDPQQDYKVDPKNCGRCGQACPADSPTCCGGRCVDLKASHSNCGGCGQACPDDKPVCCAPGPGAPVCVDVLTDPSNCGGCGAKCSGGQTCLAGACKCPVGQTLCNGVCTNTATDPNNCGACGTSCPAGQSCQGGRCSGCGVASCPNGCCDGKGACQPGRTNAVCGRDGDVCHACATGQECLDGICKCTAASCPDGCCGGGICFTFAQQNAGACGSRGVECSACFQGQTCVNGECLCNAQSCPNGCCIAGGICVNPPKDANCGKGGAACVACPSGQVCQDGQCAARSACLRAGNCTNDILGCGNGCFCHKSVEGAALCTQPFPAGFDCSKAVACQSSTECIGKFGAGIYCQDPTSGCCGRQICAPQCGKQLPG